MPKEISQTSKRDFNKQIREEADNRPYNRKAILHQHHVRAQRMEYLREQQAKYIADRRIQIAVERAENTKTDYKIQHISMDILVGRNCAYGQLNRLANMSDTSTFPGNRLKDLQDTLLIIHQDKLGTRQYGTETLRFTYRRAEKLVEELSKINDFAQKVSIAKLAQEFRRLNSDFDNTERVIAQRGINIFTGKY